MNQKTPRSSPPLGTGFRDRLAEESKPPTFAPPTKNFPPFICRVVRAVRAVRVLGAGLGFPVGPPLRSGFHPQPPISNLLVAFYGRRIARIVVHHGATEAVWAPAAVQIIYMQKMYGATAALVAP